MSLELIKTFNWDNLASMRNVRTGQNNFNTLLTNTINEIINKINSGSGEIEPASKSSNIDINLTDLGFSNTHNLNSGAVIALNTNKEIVKAGEQPAAGFLYIEDTKLFIRTQGTIECEYLKTSDKSSTSKIVYIDKNSENGCSYDKPTQSGEMIQAVGQVIDADKGLVLINITGWGTIE